MLDSVVLTRGQVWMTREVLASLELDSSDEQLDFAVMLEEAEQALEMPSAAAETHRVARCA